MSVRLAHLNGVHSGPGIYRTLATLSRSNLPRILSEMRRRNVHLSSRNVVGSPSKSELQIHTKNSSRTMATQSSVALSSQNVTIPQIPELFNPDFLDALVPGSNVNTSTVDEDGSAQLPTNPLLTAIRTENRAYTQEMAPTLSSTGSATLDAFNFLNRWSYSDEVKKYLGKAWKEDPNMTLRLIWNARSIHDGKSEKELFYRAFGWLYDNHPRTALSNLHMLVTPVCTTPVNMDIGRPHGYWKDLLNILALATCGELSNLKDRSTFLHNYIVAKTTRRRSGTHRAPKLRRTPEQVKVIQERESARAREERKEIHKQFHSRLTNKLKSDPKYRALYITIARMFAEQIRKDLKVMEELEKLNFEENKADWYKLWKSISLVGRWAPSPGKSHDRVTNISTGICQLLLSSSETYGPPAIQPLPSAAPYPVPDNTENCIILRSFYSRWVLTPLRKLIRCPGSLLPLQTRTKPGKVRYSRIPSVYMANNKTRLIKRDLNGFGQYMIDVENGKKKVNGAVLLPHELVAEATRLNNLLKEVATKSRFPLVVESRRNAIEQGIKVVNAQWHTLVERMKESGYLDNCIAICDVSEPLERFNKKHLTSVFPSVALSLMLAHLTKPPFNAGFITFSSAPEFVRLEDMEARGLASLVRTIGDANQCYRSELDIQAVFLDLLLPIAKKYKVAKQDMIKRIFIFSDMQFTELEQDTDTWETTHDKIRQAYKAAGYHVPEIVYWNTSGAQSWSKTVEVRADRKGVALMSGFSPSMLKLFMGEQKEKFTPYDMLKKALFRKSFDGLVVVD